MKKIILPMIILTLMSMALADVGVQIVTPAAVASDVPFPVQVKLNTNGEQINIAQLTFTGVALANPVFSGASKCGSCLPGGNLDVTTGTLDSGKNFLALLAPVDVDTPFSSTALTTFFTFNAMSVLADPDTPATESIYLSEEQPAKGSTDNFAAGSGGNIQLAPDYDQAMYTVNPSTCGDGIVGYVDDGAGGGIKDNGQKDGTEVNEACDTALPGGAGCNSDCTYIKSTHKIQGQTSLAAQPACSFGSTSCTLAPLTAKERLKAKLNAIFDLSCFPYQGHPETSGAGAPGFCLSTADADEDGKPDDEEPFVQLPLLLKALREFYQSLGKL